MELPIVAAAWLLAMATVAVWGAPGWLPGAAFALAAPVPALFWGRRGLFLALVAAALALAGGLRYEAWAERTPPPLGAMVGTETTVEGVIASEPGLGRTTVRYRLDVDHIVDQPGRRPTEGAVLITVGEYVEFRPGDRLVVSGEIEDPPVLEDFDYRGYLARQGIVGTMLFPRVEVLAEGSAWSYERQVTRARIALEDALQHSLPEPEASLGAGIAFGRDDGLPDELYDDFRTSGLAHIVAVSGSNVAFVTALVFLVCVRFMRRTYAIGPAAVTLLAYVAVAGTSASVLRAGLMALIFLLGLWLGRQQSSLAALGGAAIVMTAVSPATAHDVGFQLSFAATAGLIVFAPWLRYVLESGLQRIHARPYVPEIVLQTVALSLAATFATLPVIWTTFGRISLVGIFANVVVEPLFVVAFWLSLATAVAGVAWEPAGWLVGLAAYYPLAFISWLATATASLPGAAVNVPKGSGQGTMLAYAALAAAAGPAYRYLVPHEPRPEPPRSVRTIRHTVIAGSVGALAAVSLPVSLLAVRGPGELRVQMLDVGQGDAILLTTPHGHQVLVDGGPSGIELARELGATLPHWDRTLDMLVLTHPQQDHLAGFVEVLRRYDVGHVVESGSMNDSALYRLYQGEGPARTVRLQGDSWELDGVQFEVLWPVGGQSPKEVNDASLVLHVTYEGVSLLLTGDIEAKVQRELMESQDVRADVLKVPHHGSKTSDAAFFDAVDPVVAVISAGAENRFGHPHEQTLDALTGRRVYRTDLDGRVTVRVSHGRVRVASER